jgi:hypothetical protein
MSITTLLPSGGVNAGCSQPDPDLARAPLRGRPLTDLQYVVRGALPCVESCAHAKLISVGFNVEAQL